MTEAEIEQLDEFDLTYVAEHQIYTSLPSGRLTASVLETLLPGPQMLLTTNIVAGEIANGGFHQCYFNFGDEFIPLAIRGFRLIGANACADIVEATWLIYKQACSQFEAIHQEVETQQSWQPFADSYGTTDVDRYDTPFYEASESENLEARQAVYIRQHLQNEFPLLLTPQADMILQKWRERGSR